MATRNDQLVLSGASGAHARTTMAAAQHNKALLMDDGVDDEEDDFVGGVGKVGVACGRGCREDMWWSIRRALATARR